MVVWGQCKLTHWSTYANLQLPLDNRENKNSRNVCMSQIRENFYLYSISKISFWLAYNISLIYLCWVTIVTMDSLHGSKMMKPTKILTKSRTKTSFLVISMCPSMLGNFSKSVKTFFFSNKSSILHSSPSFPNQVLICRLCQYIGWFLDKYLRFI